MRVRAEHEASEVVRHSRDTEDECEKGMCADLLLMGGDVVEADFLRQEHNDQRMIATRTEASLALWSGEMARTLSPNKQLAPRATSMRTGTTASGVDLGALADVEAEGEMAHRRSVDVYVDKFNRLASHLPYTS